MRKIGKVAAWVGEHAAATVIAVVVGALVTFGATKLHGGKPAPVGDQIDALRQREAKRNMFAIYNRLVDLHGNGDRALLLVFRPRSATRDPVSGRSDLIEIYDKKDGRLIRAFSFQPRRDPVPFRFQLRGTGRFDNTDRSEIIGSLTRSFVDARFPLPVAINWDEATGRYRVQSLIPSTPRLRHVKHPGFQGETSRRLYASQHVVDTATGEAKTMYAVDAFTVRSRPFPLLVAAYTIAAECNACARTVQLNAWMLDFEQPIAAATQCEWEPVVHPRAVIDPADLWLKGQRPPIYC